LLERRLARMGAGLIRPKARASRILFVISSF